MSLVIIGVIVLIASIGLAVWYFTSQKASASNVAGNTGDSSSTSGNTGGSSQTTRNTGTSSQPSGTTGTIVSTPAPTGPVYDAATQSCINAVEQTGFIPKVTWGSTPAAQQNAQCDSLLCPYWANKYGVTSTSWGSLPDQYKLSLADCTTKPARGSCNVPLGSRVDAAHNIPGYGGSVSQQNQQCVAAGYCFDYTNANSPWCYVGQNNSTPCKVSPRIDYAHNIPGYGGDYGTQNKQCLAAGACFDLSNPNAAWCFTPS